MMLIIRFQHENKTVGYLGKGGGLVRNPFKYRLMDVSDRNRRIHSGYCVQDLKTLGLIPRMSTSVIEEV